MAYFGRSSILTLTTAALLAFAANSVLCRLALRDGLIHPIDFTVIRLFSGALMLVGIAQWRRPKQFTVGGNWWSAAAMVAYAISFSLAYVRISAGMGALILFFGVQVTMIVGDLRLGRTPLVQERIGLPIALLGLAFLLWPGVEAPEPMGAGLMALAGVAWGVYSLRGKGTSDAVADTTGNFLRGIALVLPLLIFSSNGPSATVRGMMLAIISGAITSGLGYIVWYHVVSRIAPTQAAIAQLLVPLLTAVAGVIVLSETFSLRLLISGTIIASGVALSVFPFRIAFLRR